MERIIKFRGKRVDNGEWVYGYYSRMDAENSHVIVDWENKTWYSIIPESVGQFTGLLDKTGKEIYEGDIVANFYSEKGVDTTKVYESCEVKHGLYDIGCNGHEYGFEVYGFYVEQEFLYGYFVRGETKIIGNIYEV